MDRIIDYSLLQALSTEELTAAVQRELDGGWQPLGGPLALPGGQLAQAVVRTGHSPTEGAVGTMDTAKTQVIVHGQSLTDRKR